MILAILMTVSALPVSAFAKEATGTEEETETVSSNAGIQGIGNTVLVAPVRSLTAHGISPAEIADCIEYITR